MDSSWQMSKISTVLLVVVVIVCIGLPIGLWYMTSLQRNGYSNGFDSRVAPTPSDRTAQEIKSKSGQAIKGTMTSDRYFISVNGTIVRAPQRVGERILFDFVATDDPKRHIISVAVEAAGGVIPFGLFTGSFDSSYTTALASPEEALGYLTRTSSVQLRFMYRTDRTLTEEEARGKALLDRVFDGVWDVPEGLTLYPDGIGVLR